MRWYSLVDLQRLGSTWWRGREGLADGWQEEMTEAGGKGSLLARAVSGGSETYPRFLPFTWSITWALSLLCAGLHCKEGGGGSGREGARGPGGHCPASALDRVRPLPLLLSGLCANGARKAAKQQVQVVDVL